MNNETLCPSLQAIHSKQAPESSTSTSSDEEAVNNALTKTEGGEQSCITLISKVVYPPPGVLLINIQTMAQFIRHWFISAQLPLPSSKVAAPTYNSYINDWIQKMNQASTEQDDHHWNNLISGRLELYQLTIVQRNQFRYVQATGQLLEESFHEVANLCSTDESLRSIILEEKGLFRRATLVFVVMLQGLERSINSWRNTHSQTASTLLANRLLELRKKYQFPKTPWNDAHEVSHEELDRISSLKWLSSALVDLFISNLNVKFSEPVNNRFVAFLDTNFALQYVLPGKKPCNTLINTQGLIRSKPLKALQSRFNNGRLTLIFPLNFGSTHWFIGALCGSSSTVEIFNSLDGSLSPATYDTAYKNMQNVWKVLAQAWSQDTDIQEKTWRLVIHSGLPAQSNSSDCGVFAIMYMIHLGYANKPNHDHVPICYRLPNKSENMSGMRLLLLEELELQ